MFLSEIKSFCLFLAIFGLCLEDLRTATARQQLMALPLSLAFPATFFCPWATLFPWPLSCRREALKKKNYYWCVHKLLEIFLDSVTSQPPGLQALACLSTWLCDSVIPENHRMVSVRKGPWRFSSNPSEVSHQRRFQTQDEGTLANWGTHAPRCPQQAARPHRAWELKAPAHVSGLPGVRAPSGRKRLRDGSHEWAGGDVLVVDVSVRFFRLFPICPRPLPAARRDAARRSPRALPVLGSGDARSGGRG